MQKYFTIKSLLTVPACFLAFTDYHIALMYGIVYIVSLDTILGIWVAVKYRIFSSHHLSRVFSKIGTYGIALGSAWILAAVEPGNFGWLFRYVGIFIIITEIFSNAEKLALLGFEIPVKILSRLNKQFKAFMSSDGEEKKDVASDILKNRNTPVDKC